jgi:hypothetical protein
MNTSALPHSLVGGLPFRLRVPKGQKRHEKFFRGKIRVTRR